MIEIKRLQYNQQGFTLIESIIGMMILAIALMVLTVGVYHSSNKAREIRYHVQASMLGQSILNHILNHRFDENSDPNGELYRCGEVNENDEFVACTAERNLGRDGESTPVYFNDVDDFIGCWGDSGQCTNVLDINYSLVDLIGNEDSEYYNFTIEIDVNYLNIKDEISNYKKIDVTLYASSYAEYTFSALRGNY